MPKEPQVAFIAAGRHPGIYFIGKRRVNANKNDFFDVSVASFCMQSSCHSNF